MTIEDGAFVSVVPLDAKVTFTLEPYVGGPASSGAPRPHNFELAYDKITGPLNATLSGSAPSITFAPTCAEISH